LPMDVFCPDDKQNTVFPNKHSINRSGGKAPTRAGDPETLEERLGRKMTGEAKAPAKTDHRRQSQSKDTATRVEEEDREEGDAGDGLMACVNARKIAAKMAAKSRTLDARPGQKMRGDGPHRGQSQSKDTPTRVEEEDRDEGDAGDDLMACVNARKIAAKMAAKSRSRSQRGPDMSHAEIDGKVPARAEGPDTSEDRLKRKTKGEGPERRQRHSKVPRAPGKGETKEEGERKTNSERRRPDKRHPSYSLKPPDNSNGSDGQARKKASGSSSRDISQPRSRRHSDVPHRSDAGARNTSTRRASCRNLGAASQEPHGIRRKSGEDEALKAPASRPRPSRRASERVIRPDFERSRPPSARKKK